MTLSSPLLWDAETPAFRLVGSGSRKFIHGQTTRDFLKLNNGNYIPSLWLSSVGRVKALLEIKVEDTNVEVVLIAGEIASIIDSFERVIFPADKVKVDRIYSKRRLQVLLQSKQERPYEVQYFSTESLVPSELANFEKATDEQVQEWRVIQGLPIGGNELCGEYNPFELGLADWLSLDKGCYLGQETISKVARGGKLKQELRFWRSKSLVSQGEKLLSPCLGTTDFETAGLITSSIICSSEEGSLGLAMVRRKFLGKTELFLPDQDRKIYFSVPLGFCSSSKED